MLRPVATVVILTLATYGLLLLSAENRDLTFQLKALYREVSEIERGITLQRIAAAERAFRADEERRQQSSRLNELNSAPILVRVRPRSILALAEASQHEPH